ncbi:MAG: hypothetical protein K8R90_00935 [Candidatus Cloacimonetes bacterium]|nr:hypothetical protein [Candidatus Cloacimonadota bacterium]
METKLMSLIEDFILEVRELVRVSQEIGSVSMGYAYDNDEDIHVIWHNSEILESSNLMDLIYHRLFDVFTKNGICNITFCFSLEDYYNYILTEVVASGNSNTLGKNNGFECIGIEDIDLFTSRKTEHQGIEYANFSQQDVGNISSEISLHRSEVDVTYQNMSTLKSFNNSINNSPKGNKTNQCNIQNQMWRAA